VRERERNIIREGIFIETHYIYCYYYSGERQKYSALNVSRQCPLVLLTKESWKQGN